MRLRIFRSLLPNWNFFAQSGSQFEILYRDFQNTETPWKTFSRESSPLQFRFLFVNSKFNLQSLHQTLVEEMFFSSDAPTTSSPWELEQLGHLLDLPVTEHLQIQIKLLHNGTLVRTRLFQSSSGRAR